MSFKTVPSILYFERKKEKLLLYSETKTASFQYIDGYYNKKCPHSANNMLSPDEKGALCSNGILSAIK